jgi:peptidoglycan/xylan/chitin deacetylase (PgdA/CDA1 family)
VLIVTYHAIAAPASPVATTLSQFERDLEGLASAAFTFVSLDDCADGLEGRVKTPDRSVAITFDDGYANVAALAAPVLRRLGIPATVFVIAGRIGGDNLWPGQWSSIPRMPLADLAALRAIVDAGISIGSHSSSHPSLTAVDDATLRAEVVESGDRLADLLGTPVHHFAYPYGFRNEREMLVVRGRYRTGVSSYPDIVGPNADLHDLPRIDCHDLRMALRLRVLDPAGLRPYLAIRRGARAIRRRTEALVSWRSPGTHVR